MSLYGLKELAIEQALSGPDIPRFNLIWKTLGSHIARLTEANAHVEYVDGAVVTTLEAERFFADPQDPAGYLLRKQLSARLTDDLRGSNGQQEIHACIKTFALHPAVAGDSIEHAYALKREGEAVTEYWHTLALRSDINEATCGHLAMSILHANMGGEMELGQGDINFLFRDLMEFSQIN